MGPGSYGVAYHGRPAATFTDGLAEGVALDDSYAYFFSSKLEGNALMRIPKAK